MNSEYRVDISTLKTHKESLEKEKDSFINGTYKTFSDAFEGDFSDSTIIEIKSKIFPLYNNIKDAYNNIDKWLTNYIKDFENLESSLKSRIIKFSPNSAAVLEDILQYIYNNKNEVSLCPGAISEMKDYLKNQQDSLDEELNKIDERLSYVEKYGEIEGTRKYNEDLQNITLKNKSYEKAMQDLDNVNELENIQLKLDIEKCNQILNIYYNIEELLEEDYKKAKADWIAIERDPGSAYYYFCKENGYNGDEEEAIKQWDEYCIKIYTNYIQKQNELLEVKYNIKCIENQIDMLPYNSLIGTEKYNSFVSSYHSNPENFVKNTKYETNKYILYKLNGLGTIELKNEITVDDIDVYLTEEEKNTFLYLYHYEGEEKALDYLSLLTDSVNQQKALELIAPRIEDTEYYYATTNSNNVMEAFAGFVALSGDSFFNGVEDGFMSWCEGIVDVFSSEDYVTKEEYARMYYNAYLAGKSGYYSGVYQVGTGVGSIAPTVVTGMITRYFAVAQGVKSKEDLERITKIASLITMGSSELGANIHQGKINGLDDGTAILYSLFRTSGDLFLEYTLGSVLELGGVDPNERLTIKNLFSNMFEEGLEEYIQECSGNILDAIFYGEPFDVITTSEEAANAFILTLFVVGITTTGVEGANRIISFNLDGEKYEVDLDKLVEELPKYKKENGGYTSLLNLFRKNETYSLSELSDLYDTKPEKLQKMLLNRGLTKEQVLDLFNKYSKEDFIYIVSLYIDSNCQYNFSESIKNKYLQLNKIVVDKEIGENLAELVSDDNYVYGVHVARGNAEVLNNIYLNGLWITGDSSSGVANDYDIYNNVVFLNDNDSVDNKVAGIINRISINKYGVVIKIPKEYIKGIDSYGNYIFDYSKIYYEDETGRTLLRPEFVVAKLESSNDSFYNISDTSFKNDLQIRKIEFEKQYTYEDLNEESKISLMFILHNERYFSFEELNEIGKSPDAVNIYKRMLVENELSENCKLYVNDIESAKEKLLSKGLTNGEVDEMIQNNDFDSIINILNNSSYRYEVNPNNFYYYLEEKCVYSTIVGSFELKSDSQEHLNELVEFVKTMNKKDVEDLEQKFGEKIIITNIDQRTSYYYGEESGHPIKAVNLTTKSYNRPLAYHEISHYTDFNNKSDNGKRFIFNPKTAVDNYSGNISTDAYKAYRAEAEKAAINLAYSKENVNLYAAKAEMEVRNTVSEALPEESIQRLIQAKTEEYLRDLKNDILMDFGIGPLDDIFEALGLKDWVGFGHAEGYYSDPERAREELVANIGSLYKMGLYDLLYDFFPKEIVDSWYQDVKKMYGD